MERWAEHPAGPALLALFAVLEATVFPAPTEALLVALGMGRPRRAAWLTALTTVASGVGSAAGYLLGLRLFESGGRDLVAWYGATDQLAAVGALYEENLVLALVTSGYTPIPYLLYTFAAGAFAVPFLPFLVSAVAGRALKYALYGMMAYSFGSVLRRVADRPWFRPAALAAAALALVGALLWLGMR